MCVCACRGTFLFCSLWGLWSLRV
uniref:Uncharacterized protein n=1 Tax=Anguilla anguilla TaxID=7936 RepID=A0A0E9PNR5_ANGAN